MAVLSQTMHMNIGCEWAAAGLLEKVIYHMRDTSDALGRTADGPQFRSDSSGATLV
jgi:hypothetical protein